MAQPGMTPVGSNGLLDEEAYNRARQQQSQMGLWAGLLAGGGPSLKPTNFGAALGQGLLGMQQTGAQFDEAQYNQAKTALARAGVPKTQAEAEKLRAIAKLLNESLNGGSDVPMYLPGAPDIGRLPSPGGGAAPVSIEPGGGSDPRGVSPLIRAKAVENGIDPDVALRVAKSEGLGQFYGDGGKSGTAFQLYTGGGWGNDFQRETGLNPLDPKNEPAAIDYTMKRVAREGWGAFNGAKKIGVKGFDGIGRAAPAQTAQAGGMGILPLSNEAAPIAPPIAQAGPVAAPQIQMAQAQPAPAIPPIAQPPQAAPAQPPAPPIAAQPQMAQVPPAAPAPPIAMPQAPQMQQPPAPMMPPSAMPQGPGQLNPAFVRQQQQRALGLSAAGITVPGYINQGAELPFAGAKAGMEAAAKQPYELQRIQEQQRLDIGKAGPIASAEDAARRTPDQKEYASYVDQEIKAGRVPLSQLDYTRAVRQAGATNVTQRVEGQGQAEVIKFGIRQMEGAFQAESDAQKRTQVYGQMAQAMQGFGPGASADLQRRTGAILKDIGINAGAWTGGVPSAEVFQQAAQKLQLNAAPKGQGAVSNYERELYAKASPQLINTPEALAQMIQIGQRLDDYDRQVAQIHRDVAKESGGLPNPIEAQQRIAALGPPLSPAETQALQAIQKPTGGANAPATVGGQSGTTSGGIPWSVR